MRREMGILHWIWLPFLLCKAEVYMVQLHNDNPVVAYSGTIEGFASTDVSNGEKGDATSPEVQRYVSYLINKHDALLASAFEAGTFAKLYSYCHVVNGFAAILTPLQAEVLRSNDNVRFVELAAKVYPSTTHTPEFLGISQGVWPQLGGFEGAGEDVVIGLVDTGINPVHPSFASDKQKSYGPLKRFTGQCDIGKNFPAGSCNGKIIGARLFAKAAEASGDFNASNDLLSPFDTFGHGTHTASTAGGNHGVDVSVDGVSLGYASGIAPRARIAMYRTVFPDGGNLADTVAAIDQAVQDGVDILSLSIHFSPPANLSTFLSTFDLALLFAIKAGVFIVHSAGNFGPTKSSINSFGPWIMQVAAGTTDRNYNKNIILDNSMAVEGEGISPGTPGLATYKLVFASDAYVAKSMGTVSVNQCQEAEHYNQEVVQESILLCAFQQNDLVNSTVLDNVVSTTIKLGALGFVIDLSKAVILDMPTTYPVAAIALLNVNASEALFGYYNSSTPRDHKGIVKTFGAKARIVENRLGQYNNRAPEVALFSSRGPDILSRTSFEPIDVLKPNILAPGYEIWAAWSPKSVAEFPGENFALLSGTSMAAPHIAGIAALIKQKHSTWSPSAIASSLTTTASSVDNMGKPILAQTSSPYDSFGAVSPSKHATPFDCGAGSVNTKGALDPGLVFEAGFDDYIKFLCSVPGANRSSIPKLTRQKCSSVFGWASDLNLPSITVSNLNGSRSVPRTVKNVAGITETYTVGTIEQPRGVSVTVSPNSFTVEPGQSTALKIKLVASSLTKTFTFGKIILQGDRGHEVRIVLSIRTIR